MWLIFNIFLLHQLHETKCIEEFIYAKKIFESTKVFKGLLMEKFKYFRENPPL